MNIFRTVLPAVAGVLALSAPALGQGAAAAPDSLILAATAAAERQYNRSFVSHPQLFNGPEYVNYARRYHASLGHQYFLAPEKLRGGVLYNDHYFANLRLAYDAVLGQVVLPQPSSPLTLRLVNEHVRAFDIEGHHFIRLVADSAAAGALRTGYYEVLVEAPVQVLARRSKRMQERIQNGFVDVEFIPTEKLFIRQGNTYYPIARKAAALRLFADRSAEVQQFIKAQKLSFKKARFEADLVQLARYYNGLPPR